MFRIILPVLFLSALLIFGDDGSRIIMGVTGSTSTLQDRTSARFNAETLINKEQAVLQFGSSDGADQIEASVTQLYGMNSPGEFFLFWTKRSMNRPTTDFEVSPSKLSAWYIAAITCWTMENPTRSM